MEKGLVAKAEIVINASPVRVWEALTTPELVKQYLFGTEVSSTWAVGSSITYKGEWQGKAYEDKGTVLEVEPERRLVSTYWSSMGGLEDKPENYKTVSYILEPEGEGTRLTITQDNETTEEGQKHSQQNWNMVLEGIKKLLEQ